MEQGPKLRFGFTIPRPDPRMGPHGYERVIECCELAEELGFDFGAVGNHRFSPDALDPSAPFVLLSAVAARTTRLRLLTSVLVLPLYQPLDVAEQVATLDQLSGGRVILGVGIGYRPYEYEALGLAFKQRASRAEEALEVLYQAWTEPSVSFRGRHFEVSDAAVLPRPFQDPHPPVWLGGQSRAAVNRAARMTDGWIVGYLEPLPALADVVGEYRSAAADAGRPATVCLMRKVGIGHSREQVERSWLPGALDVFRHYRNAGGRWRGERPMVELLESGRAVGLADVIDTDQLVVGSPDDCISAIRRCRAVTGCEHLLASFGSGSVTAMEDRDFDELSTSMRLFAAEVMPAFR